MRDSYPWLSRVKESFYLSDSNDVAKESERIDKQVLEYGLSIVVEPSYFCSELAYDFVVANREKYQIVLIHSTRDTLKRSVSHYLHQKSKGRCVNLADCIEKFPEIITESDYGTFKRRWLASDCKFLEIDVVSPTAITTLQETGLNIHRIGTSNVRYRPMFPRIMGFLVWLREGWMGKILMRILPERILRAVKKIFLYGGDEVSVTTQELQQLERLISGLDEDKNISERYESEKSC